MTEEPIKFIQKSESTKPKLVLVHISGLETFICSLNPAASLYEDVADTDKVFEYFSKLKEYLKEKDIKLITVEEALSMNKESDELMNLAISSLNYEKIDKKIKEVENESQEKKRLRKNSFEDFLMYSSDDYKKKVLGKFSKKRLIDVILTRPTIQLKHIETDTHIEPTLISFNPLGNLIFCRDQQITTQKGVIIGRTRTQQRKFEHIIMKQAFKNLKVDIIGEIPEKEDYYLEGGDYFVARENLSMLGVGLRTSINGANYIAENDLLGTRYFAICYDEKDKDQQRMHLDTYFNILNDENAVVIDFDEVGKQVNKKIDRKVYYYDNSQDAVEIKSDNELVKNKLGQYKLIKIYDSFYEFLDAMKFKYIKITHEEQKNYMINFLNIGDNTVISVNKNLEEKVKHLGITVKFIDCEHILNMYGGMHCMTQVSRF